MCTIYICPCVYILKMDKSEAYRAKGCCSTSYSSSRVCFERSRSSRSGVGARCPGMLVVSNSPSTVMALFYILFIIYKINIPLYIVYSKYTITVIIINFIYIFIYKYMYNFYFNVKIFNIIPNGTWHTLHSQIHKITEHKSTIITREKT